MESENKYNLAQQLIVNDLGIASADLSINRLDELKQWLSEEVRLLLDHDFQRLLNILYRIDVSEKKTSIALASDDPAQAIARLIIERELQKVESRKKYRD